MKKIAFKCSKCPRSFYETARLKKHMIGIQNESSEMTCDKCDYKTHGYNMESLLLMHNRVKHEGLRYKCDQCNEEFAQLYNMNSHKKTHLE